MAVSFKTGTFNAATSTGNQAITGVGFAPVALVLLGVGTTTPGAWNAHTLGGIGLVTGTTEQHAIAWSSLDGSATQTSIVHRIEDVAFLQTNTSSTAIIRRATLASFDADGFTLNWHAVAGVAAAYLALALSGVDAQAGALTKEIGAAPEVQAVTGVGFAPGALLFASTQSTVVGTQEAQARIGIGAADGTSAWATAIQSEDAVATSNVSNYTTTGAAIVVADNATDTIDAEADLTSFDADGFTLTWTTNDAVATRIAYLALADPAAGGDATGTTSTDTLSVTGQTVTGTAQRNETGTTATDTLTVTGQGATAAAGASATTSTDAITVVGQSVTATADQSATGTTATQTITVSGQSVTAAAQRNETGVTATEAITVTGQSASASASVAATPLTDTITVSGQSVSASAGATGSTTTDAITVVGQSVTATAPTEATGTTATDTITVVGQTVTATGTRNETGQTATDTIAVTGQTVTAAVLISAANARAVWTQDATTLAATWTQTDPTRAAVWTQATPTLAATWAA